MVLNSDQINSDEFVEQRFNAEGLVQVRFELDGHGHSVLIRLRGEGTDIHSLCLKYLKNS